MFLPGICFPFLDVEGLGDLHAWTEIEDSVKDPNDDGGPRSDEDVLLVLCRLLDQSIDFTLTRSPGMVRRWGLADLKFISMVRVNILFSVLPCNTATEINQSFFQLSFV